MSITLKKPATDKGYASKDSGLGKIFALSVNGSETIHLSNVKSHSKVGATDRKDEVYQINKSYNNSRKYIAKSILKYLIENDGVVDAWPNPDTGLSMGFRLSDDNDEDTRGNYDTYYYNFDYFASDFESDKYGLICLAEYIKSKTSKERKEAFEENERLKEEYTQLMDDFHHRWYSYVTTHSK